MLNRLKPLPGGYDENLKVFRTWRQFLIVTPKVAPPKYDIWIFFVFIVSFSGPTPYFNHVESIKTIPELLG